MNTTVLIPCKDYGRYLKDALDSATCQTRACKIIVVNDGSTDNTSVILKQYADKYVGILKYYERESTGTASAARNYGLKHVKTKYVLFLDADDVLDQRYVEMGEKFLDAHPDYSIFAPYAESFENEHQIMPITGFIPELLQRNTVHYTAMVKKSLLSAIGGYDELIPYTGFEDWDLWIRAYLSGAKLYVEKTPLLKYRIHKDNMTHLSIGPHVTELINWIKKKHNLEQ